MPGFVQRAARQPDRLRFESEVTAAEGPSVELAETYFFAASGGQPADRGTIAGEQVTDVRIEGDRIVHDLESDPELAVGETVGGEIDPDFRRYCRRAHTASHVLYGAARREVSGLGYGGFEIDDRKVRLDFASDSTIDETTVVELEGLANLAIWESRDVRWEELPREEARTSEDVAFNAATEDVFEDSETVRIVEIDGWDRAACGGTHLRNTAEIGPLTVLDRSNPGKGLTRIEFAVGPQSIETATALHAAAREAGRRLNVSPTEIDEATAEIQDRLDSREAHIESLERALVDERVASFDVVSPGEFTWRVGRLPDVESDVSTEALRMVVREDTANVVVGLGGDERTTITVASDGTVDANQVIDRITDDLGGGGGGNATLAQGGGIPQSPGRVRNVLVDVIEAIEE